MTLLATVKWSLWRHSSAADSVALFSADLFETTKLLAVVVPTHAGDIEEAVVALSKWPDVCSAITLHRMQLVVYYAGNEGDGVWSDDVIPAVARTGGRCFERTRVVFANLDKEVRASSGWSAKSIWSRFSLSYATLSRWDSRYGPCITTLASYAYHMSPQKLSFYRGVRRQSPPNSIGAFLPRTTSTRKVLASCSTNCIWIAT